jgi:hypothetical protein
LRLKIDGAFLTAEQIAGRGFYFSTTLQKFSGSFTNPRRMRVRAARRAASLGASNEVYNSVS